MISIVLARTDIFVVDGCFTVLKSLHLHCSQIKTTAVNSFNAGYTWHLGHPDRVFDDRFLKLTI